MVSPARHIEAMEKVSALVSVRDRSVKETSERLEKHGFSSEEIDDAISTALRIGLIDELRYTSSYIRGKSNSGWGKRKIVQRLHSNGISDETILACEENFPSPKQEYENALRELSKRKSNSKNPYVSYMRRLIGKGYSQDTASRAVKAYLSDEV